jgi:ABC-type Fe3+-hydroxamate transport system substrate-binding protein
LPICRTLLAIALIALPGLGVAPSIARPSGAPLGTTPAKRIVTLMPSFADDLYAIGSGGKLVAVSAYTEEPQAAKLPRVADATSVDVEAIVALHPDAVVGIPAQERLVEPLRRAGIHVVLLSDNTYASIFTNLRALGALSGHEPQAAAAIARLQRETARLHARVVAFARRPSVFVVLGTGPIWTAGAGSYIATLLDLAGGANAAGDLREPYGQYSAEALVRDQPDAIVADPSMHLDALLGREPWRSLRAVRLHHVYVSQRADDLERPGPAYVKGLQWLVDRLTPLATR